MQAKIVYCRKRGSSSMNTNYVNVYECTEDVCEKAAVYIYYRRIVALISHIVLAAVCVTGTVFTVYYLTGSSMPKYHYSTYFFYALAPIVAELVIFVKFRMMLKKEKELICENGGKLTVTADNEKLTETIDGSVIAESPLFDVEKVYETDAFFLVSALSGEYFIFKRGCFTQGNEENFVADVKGRVKEIHDAAIAKSKKPKY